jgi:hypothetical protein
MTKQLRGGIHKQIHIHTRWYYKTIIHVTSFYFLVVAAVTDLEHWGLLVNKNLSKTSRVVDPD